MTEHNTDADAAVVLSPTEAIATAPAAARADMGRARALTLDIERLNAQIQELHEERGTIVTRVKARHPSLSYSDLSLMMGVNRQRAAAIVDEHKNGSRQSRRRRPVPVAVDVSADEAA